MIHFLLVKHKFFIVYNLQHLVLLVHSLIPTVVLSMSANEADPLSRKSLIVVDDLLSDVLARAILSGKHVDIRISIEQLVDLAVKSLSESSLIL